MIRRLLTAVLVAAAVAAFLGRDGAGPGRARVREEGPVARGAGQAGRPSACRSRRRSSTTTRPQSRLRRDARAGSPRTAGCWRRRSGELELARDRQPRGAPRASYKAPPDGRRRRALLRRAASTTWSAQVDLMQRLGDSDADLVRSVAALRAGHQGSSRWPCARTRRRATQAARRTARAEERGSLATEAQMQSSRAACRPRSSDAGRAAGRGAAARRGGSRPRPPPPRRDREQRQRPHHRAPRRRRRPRRPRSPGGRGHRRSAISASRTSGVAPARRPASTARASSCTCTRRSASSCPTAPPTSSAPASRCR